MNVFEFTFVSINSTSMPLRNFQGQPLLIVNTASDCDYTPQYKALQKIWSDYHHSGLIVIGIPCNDFGEKEPGNEEEIAEFCASRYRVSFPMTGKCNLTGVYAHPLFRSIREEFGDDRVPRWNFHKYLFDRNGQLISSWPSSVAPDDPLISHQIERHLQSWVV